MRDTLSPSGAPRSGEATRIYELPGRPPPIIWTRAVERSDEGVRDVALRRSVVRGHLNPAARDASDGRHRQLGAERISAFEVQRDGERLVPLVDGINRSSAPGARPLLCAKPSRGRVRDRLREREQDLGRELRVNHRFGAALRTDDVGEVEEGGRHTTVSPARRFRGCVFHHPLAFAAVHGCHPLRAGRAAAQRRPDTQRPEPRRPQRPLPSTPPCPCSLG